MKNTEEMTMEAKTQCRQALIDQAFMRGNIVRLHNSNTVLYPIAYHEDTCLPSNYVLQCVTSLGRMVWGIESRRLVSFDPHILIDLPDDSMLFELTLEGTNWLTQQGYAVICGDGQAQHIVPEPLS